MKIYIARHGQTNYNAYDRICGATDAPLNQKGFEQAEQLAEEVAKHPGIALTVVSPMLRAQQTADAVLRRCPMDRRTDSRLREQDYGCFEGKVKGMEPDFRVARWQFAKPCPGGESIFQMAQRIYNFLDELIQENPAGEVLLVAHGSVSRVVRSYFVPMSNEEYAEFSQKNGTLEIYDTEEGAASR